MISRPASLVDVDGKKVPIAQRLIIGRSRDVDIVVPTSRVTRHHLALLRLPSGEIEAEDLGSTNGSLFNGAPLRHHLVAQGDVLEVDGVRWVVELGTAVRPPDPAAELLATADTEAALQVAIDLLLERGDPVGKVLAEGQQRPLSRLLEDSVEQGVLDLEWRRGFIHSARLRAQSFFGLRTLLIELLRAEASRFLSGLSLPEYQTRFGLAGAPLRTLRRFQLGPFFTAESAARTRQALEAEPFTGAPHLGAPEVQQFSEAWLEFPGSQRRNLEQGRQETFPSCTVRWEPDGWIVWRVRQNATLLVNGRTRPTAVLAPGDVVSSGPTQFTFRAR